MKKKLVGLLIGAMGFMLVACTAQDKETEVPAVDNQEIESTTTDASEDEIYESTAMSNPWVDSDKAGVLAATGFDMVAPAEAAAKVGDGILNLSCKK